MKLALEYGQGMMEAELPIARIFLSPEKQSPIPQF